MKICDKISKMVHQVRVNKPYFIGNSKIHGKGVMASRNLKDDEIVGLGIAFRVYCIPYVTPEFGSFINHSYNPSAYLYWYDGPNCPNEQNGGFEDLYQEGEGELSEMGWYVRTQKPLKRGEEITVNYNHTPWYIEGPKAHYV